MHPQYTSGLLDREEANQRLQELLIYIAQKCQDYTHFGAIKLNKTLYFADFINFRKTGRSITGSQYMKLPNGPVPQQMKFVLEDLRAKGHLVRQEREHFGNLQHRYIPLREPNLELFSATDIALVDSIIEDLGSLNASQVSGLSHNRVWRIARLKEMIPYEAVFISDEGVTDDDISIANELAEKYGWAA